MSSCSNWILVETQLAELYFQRSLNTVQAEEGESDEEEHEPPISLAQMARHWMEVHNRLTYKFAT